MDFENKIQKLKECCKQAGMRLTNQRTEIYRALCSTSIHPDAETLHGMIKNKFGGISLDTVYRTLESLEELGLITRVDSILPKARFDADLTSHCHFICKSCANIYDIREPFEIKYQCSIGKVLNANLQLKGICSECMKKGETNYGIKRLKN